MIPVAGWCAGGAAVLWVVIYWRMLVLRSRVIAALKLNHAGLYEEMLRSIRSAGLLDRIFATPEVVAAQTDHEALLLNREATPDVGIRSLQICYTRWSRLLFGYTVASIVAMLLAAWLSWR